jgi:transcriptional regulator with XRE-family HTH domain
MTRAPTGVDAHIGRAIRERRNALGISQERLAQQLGITFQQVQKYESGRNRVSASRLVDIATVLDMPVGCFLPQRLPVEDGQHDSMAEFGHRVLINTLIAGHLQAIEALEWLMDGGPETQEPPRPAAGDGNRTGR